MTITVKSRYLELIRTGRKISTIRLWKRCTVQRGDPLTFTDYRSSAYARCIAVERMRVADLADSDACADGFDSRDELLAALRHHYPALTADTLIWVIRFELVRGAVQENLFTHSGKSARS